MLENKKLIKFSNLNLNKEKKIERFYSISRDKKINKNIKSKIIQNCYFKIAGLSLENERLRYIKNKFKKQYYELLDLIDYFNTEYFKKFDQKLDNPNSQKSKDLFKTNIDILFKNDIDLSWNLPKNYDKSTGNNIKIDLESENSYNSQSIDYNYLDIIKLKKLLSKKDKQLNESYLIINNLQEEIKILSLNNANNLNPNYNKKFSDILKIKESYNQLNILYKNLKSKYNDLENKLNNKNDDILYKNFSHKFLNNSYYN